MPDWVVARVEPGTAQWLMDIGVLHYADGGWVVDRDIWGARRDSDAAAIAAPCGDMAVPQDQLAPAEGIARKGSA